MERRQHQRSQEKELQTNYASSVKRILKELTYIYRKSITWIKTQMNTKIISIKIKRKIKSQ